jgi:threonine/homoserine/homoserine lactone efflux protein
MDPGFFIKGLIVGFAMAVPIGPIGVMCIRKTLADGHSRGLIIGLGAATADALYGSIAAFGLTFISNAIASQHTSLRLFGGGLLLWLGARRFRARPKGPIVAPGRTGGVGAYASAFLLALTNPLTIFSFIAIFAALGLGHQLAVVSACLLVVGVFAGSCLWFLTLGYIATLFRRGLDAGGLTWVNRGAGALLIASGITVFVSAL